ncbi:MAG: hypothetical protein RL205_1507 [Actinomycetota bacterium]
MRAGGIPALDMGESCRPPGECLPQRALALGAAAPAKLECLVRVEGELALQVVECLGPRHLSVDLITFDDPGKGLGGSGLDGAAESVALSAQRVRGADDGMKLRSWS